MCAAAAKRHVRSLHVGRQKQQEVIGCLICCQTNESCLQAVLASVLGAALFQPAGSSSCNQLSTLKQCVCHCRVGDEFESEQKAQEHLDELLDDDLRLNNIMNQVRLVCSGFVSSH